ncbi:Secretion protein HlyD [Planctomycetales bacterium 10988]|nr:Secretion protein HlyD [Planctomycetales bacterium 10988]
MNLRFSQLPLKWLGIIAVLALLGAGWMTQAYWLPTASGFVQQTIGLFRPHHQSEEEEDPHAGHDHEGHDHAGHDEGNSLELSQQALRNIGLSEQYIQPIVLDTYDKTITIPAVVAEKPGRSRVQVATPMTGVVTHVHAVEGEAVKPGTLLFKIRLTHEDLVQTQTDFLRTLGELDVEEREIERLQGVTNSGAVAGKVLLDRKYERDKLTAMLKAQREAMKMHGLSEEHVDKIEEDRQLLRELQVFAPSIDEHGEEEINLAQQPFTTVAYQDRREQVREQETERKKDGPLIIQDLQVHKGQSVQSGETLCILVDYQELYIEGLAFEQDISQLRMASQKGWKVEALFEEPGSRSRIVKDLEIAYLSNQVNPDTRALPFYVHLPNKITKDRRDAGDPYIEWQYLPGQRLQLRVPVEKWKEQIVLPIEAVAKEGAEYFIFQQNGDHFDRVPVHVTYRDQHTAVIANDGSLYPGDVVAMRGAHQMQMALKNKAGGAVDPHAGHNH